MCGITGYFKFSIFDLPPHTLQTATTIISHRGPDDAGYFEEESVGLGHRRLSIIDLSTTGHQPMESESGRYVIAYNGEIYNYRELKAELISKGYSFRGHSDTEVVINGFEHWGNTVFKKLNGIFAISIWDKSYKKLTLVRDRLGVKPLYFSKGENLLAFGSEIKSILKITGERPDLNLQGFHEFIYYGYGLGTNTLYKSIQKITPGHILEIDKKGIQESSFLTYSNILKHQNDINEKEAIGKSRELLENAISRQLVSDVPVGVFLSGGIDSSAITAFASRHYKGKLLTYSAGFDFDNGHNELPLAAKVAKQFNTQHQELFIKGKDLPDIVEKLVFHHDEPFSDAANIPLYLMTQAVKNQCKVILQGDGGDELFGGYPRYHIMKKFKTYKAIFSLLHQFKDFLPFKYAKEKTERFYPLFSEKNTGKKFAKFLTEEIEGIPELMYSKRINHRLLETNPFKRYDEITKDLNFIKDDVQKLLWLDMRIILPDQFLEKVDKSTMANGVEVRVPFLDNELVDFVLALPADLKLKKGIKKYILKKAFDGILPTEVLYGPKKGFGVPYGNWIKGPLYDFMNDTLFSDKIRGLNIYNEQIVKHRILQHKNGERDWGFSLWKALNLSIWLTQNNFENFE